MTNKMDINLINSIAFVFEDDAIYSMYIRKHLTFQELAEPNQLYHKATKYVSAKAQAMLTNLILEAQLLTGKEEDIYKRGRNINNHTKVKNADVVIYRMLAGFEATMGYLHMTGQIERLRELIDWCVQVVEKIEDQL